MACAIFTKYLGPTNTRGSRVKAYTAVGQRAVTLVWEPGLSSFENHQRAASKLALHLGWIGEWTAGDAGDEYVWVRRAPGYTHAEDGFSVNVEVIPE